jgi:hypothetical protein
MTMPTAVARKVQKVVLPGQSPEGQYILAVIVKRTYRIVPDGPAVRAPEDRKILTADKYYVDPVSSSVEFESDFVPYKLATDVVLNGKVNAPRGVPTESCVATLSVGGMRKDLLVIGDRVCHHDEGLPPLFSDPAPFVTMDLTYERAYGGVDVYSDPTMAIAYVRNHVGRGFAVENMKAAVEGLELPNIEDPADPLTPDRLLVGHFMYWEQQPIPQGFGWVAKQWQPRASLAGVMPADRLIEQELRKAYAEVVPPEQRELYEQTQLPDMDFAFFNGASPGLVFEYLHGDETISAGNLTPEGVLTFQLPGDRPRIGLDIGLAPSDPEVVLQTVMIRLEDREVDLVWRAAFPYPGPDWLPEMRKMDVVIE